MRTGMGETLSGDRERRRAGREEDKNATGESRERDSNGKESSPRRSGGKRDINLKGKDKGPAHPPPHI